MSVSRSSLPLLFPPSLGRCHARQRIQGKACVIHLAGIYSEDPALSESLAACVGWLVDTLRIKHLASGAVEIGEGWHVERDWFNSIKPESILPSMTLGASRDLLRPDSFGVSRFVQEGRFRGTIYGLGNAQCHAEQVAALGQLSLWQEQLVHLLDRVAKIARQRVNARLHPRCQDLLQFRPEGRRFDLEFINPLLETAKKVGVDIARFPYLHLLERFKGWQMLNLTLVQAVEEVDDIAKQLELWLTENTLQEVKARRRALQNARSQDDGEALSIQAYSLCLWGKRIAEDFKLPPPQFKRIREAVEGYDSLQRFISEGLEHLDEEAHALYLTTSTMLAPEDNKEEDLAALDTIEMARDLCALELTYRDFMNLLAGGVTTEQLLKSIESLGLTVEVDHAVLNAAISLGKSFYYWAVRRSRLMSDFIKEWDRKHESDDEAVLLIETEGFHTSPIQEELAERPIDYFSIMPRYSKDGKEDIDWLTRSGKEFYASMAESWRRQFLPRLLTRNR